MSEKATEHFCNNCASQVKTVYWDLKNEKVICGFCYIKEMLNEMQKNDLPSPRGLRFNQLTGSIQQKVIQDQIGFEIDLFADEGPDHWLHKATVNMPESEDICNFIDQFHRQAVIDIINSSDYWFDSSGNQV